MMLAEPPVPAAAIFMAATMRRARAIGVDIDTILSRLRGRCGVDLIEFADGSLQVPPIAAEEAHEAIFRPIMADIDDWIGGRPKFGTGYFNGLSGFGPSGFETYFYGLVRYESRIISIVTGDARHGQFGCPLDACDARIMFRRSPSKRSLEQLGEQLLTWANSAGQHGIAGEGPITLKSEVFQVTGRMVQCQLDLSRSGQNTFNGLVVLLARLAEDLPIGGAYFTEQPIVGRSFSNLEGVRGQETRTIPIKSTPAKRKSPSRRSKQPSTVCTGGSGILRVETELFRLCVAEDFDPSNTHIHLTVDSTVSPSDRRHVHEALASWLLIGQRAGYGEPFHFASEISTASDGSLRAFVDLGAADYQRAFDVLVRVCEHLTTSGVPIDAVLIGRTHTQFPADDE